MNNNVHGQSTSQYYHKNPLQVYEGEDISISVTLFVTDPIISGILFFRSKGQMSYQEIPMQYVNGTWEGVIAGINVEGEGIEYVVILHKRSWGRISVPYSDKPFDNPLFINISNKEISENERLTKPTRSRIKNDNYVDADILVLSPEPGSINRPDEVVIAASLFNTDIVDTTNYRVLIDGKDYSQNSILDGGILTLTPEELSVGPHFIRLLFKTSYGLDISPIEWSFNINKAMVNVSESFRYKGNIGASNSNTSASGIELKEQENNGKIDGELSWVKVRYSYRNSSRQSSFIQPLNRETLTLTVTDYLKLEYGDVYPSISPFLLDGKRVRGRHIHIDLPWFDFQYVSGKLNEQVDYKEGKVDGGYKFLVNNTELNADGTRIFNFTRTGYTFPQSVSATRLSFTFFKLFSGGLHFLKAWDSYDEMPMHISDQEMFTFTSLDSTLDSAYIFNDYINDNNEYNYGDFKQLSLSNGDSIIIPLNNWDGVKPKENLVAGFNFETALDNRNIIFQLAWNYSLTNNNIWNGPLTLDELDTKLDSLKDGKIMDVSLEGVPDPDDYKTLFTINEFMTPFAPIDPVTLKKNPFRAIINMPSSALHLRLKGSYTLNNILLEYKQIGPEFYTFGNPYMTNNIREFTIKDRLSLLGRRLMFVVGYSTKDNNLSETVLNPLKTNTIMLNTTLVPGPGAPSIVFNMQIIGKNNGIDSVEIDSLGQFLKDNREDSRALNTLFSVNIPGSMGPISNTIAINYNSISYKDVVATDEKYLDNPRRDDFLFQKSDTRTISANISSRFPFPLRTVLNFNKTQIFMPMIDQNLNAIKNEIAWTSGGIDGTYSLKNNSIRINSGVDYMTNGNDENSVKIIGLKLGGDWDIKKNMVFSAKSNIRLNGIKSNKDDGLDNDEDGKIDNNGEVWSTSNSGMVFSINYRF